MHYQPNFRSGLHAAVSQLRDLRDQLGGLASRVQAAVVTAAAETLGRVARVAVEGLQRTYSTQQQPAEVCSPPTPEDPFWADDVEPLGESEVSEQAIPQAADSIVL